MLNLFAFVVWSGTGKRNFQIPGVKGVRQIRKASKERNDPEWLWKGFCGEPKPFRVITTILLRQRVFCGWFSPAKSWEAGVWAAKTKMTPDSFCSPLQYISFYTFSNIGPEGCSQLSLLDLIGCVPGYCLIAEAWFHRLAICNQATWKWTGWMKARDQEFLSPAHQGVGRMIIWF